MSSFCLTLVLCVMSLLPAARAEVYGTAVDPEVAIRAGLQFLDQHKADVDFEVEPTLEIARTVRQTAEDEALAPMIRSRAHLVLAGIHGKISDLLRAHGGTAHGKLALLSLHEAIRLNPKNGDAAIAFATTIARMLAKGRITRRFIEIGMGISLELESEKALKALEAAGQANHPLHSAL